MQRENRTIKPLVFGGVIFISLGLILATETLARFGLDENYFVVFSLAVVLAALLLGKNWIVVAIVLTGVAAINLPDATLLRYYLDRDIMLAVLCAFILVPSVYDLINRAG